MTHEKRERMIQLAVDLLEDIQPGQTPEVQIALAQAIALACIADQLRNGFLDINAYVSEP